LILDSGALIAIGRNDRKALARVLAAYEEEEPLRTHAMVVAQVWRDGRKQALLARLLRSVEVVQIDEDLGRKAGELVGRARTSDPIDAAVVLIAGDREVVLTSDPHDIRHLARAAKRDVIVVHC
jgi:predicted nucleic acid-binding protein